jgi:hypothetical protein
LGLCEALSMIEGHIGGHGLVREVVSRDGEVSGPTTKLSREPAKRASRLERGVGHQLVSALQFVRRRFLEKRNPWPHHLFRDVERQ